MEPTFDWYIQDQVILHRGFGDQTLENVRQNSDTLIQMMNNGKVPVHLIIDMRYIGKMPTNLLNLSRAAACLTHPSVGWILTVTTNPVVSFLGGIIPQIASLRQYRVVPTLDAAITFLREQEPRLDWSTAKENLLEV